jgi:hypothetical protein
METLFTSASWGRGWLSCASFARSVSQIESQRGGTSKGPEFERRSDSGRVVNPSMRSDQAQSVLEALGTGVPPRDGAQNRHGRTTEERQEQPPALLQRRGTAALTELHRRRRGPGERCERCRVVQDVLRGLEPPLEARQSPFFPLVPRHEDL